MTPPQSSSHPNGLTLFHTGIVVDDLDRGMREFTSVGGHRWAPPRIAETPMRGPEGVIPRRVRFTYSLDGPHHIELLEQLDTRAYEVLPGGRRIHHLGYLSEDLSTDSERLDKAGLTMVMRGTDDNGSPSRASYHFSDNSPNMWMELVDQATWADLRSWIDAAKHEAS